nr:uncharacterized protein LOC122271390 [Parasteatoda tepidariorum]
MMDEIHLKPYFDFKGGNVVGAAFDSSHAATSAHAFMIQSLLSNYKDVVFVLPVKTLTAETLHDIIKRVVVDLEDISFTVVAVVSDSNSINRKAMSLFSNPPQLSVSFNHPVDSDRPLYYVIDAVHIFKCIRNNWLNPKNDRQSMNYPSFDSNVISKLDTACFKTLKELHELEHTNLLKYGYSLTLKALNPTNLERQNANLVLKIFNEHVIAALIELGEKLSLNYCKQTAAYIHVILNWWNVVNVKTPDKGKRLKNIIMHPLTNSPVDEGQIFLQQFITWMNIWQDYNPATGKLKLLCT